MTDAPIDFSTDAPAKGSLDVRWIHGAPARRKAAQRNADDPPIQVHQHDPHTVIMRQSKSVNYEAPFLFLLFGNDRALLLDTGATEDPETFPLRATVDQLIAGWLAEHRPEQSPGNYELVVAHTHGHGDHVAGDGQFAGRPGTTVVPRELDDVQKYFGFIGWPEQITTFDLGGRVLEITGSPGHHRAAITVYDPWTGFLLTGDTVYPGRLYAFDFPQFVASLDRMVALAESRPVTHVLGCHIEMTSRAGRDYPLGAGYQPDEPALEMTVGQLWNVRAAAASVAGRPGEHRFDDFIIYNEPGRREQRKLAVRARVHKIWPTRLGRAAKTAEARARHIDRPQARAYDHERRAIATLPGRSARWVGRDNRATQASRYGSPNPSSGSTGNCGLLAGTRHSTGPPPGSARHGIAARQHRSGCSPAPRPATR